MPFRSEDEQIRERSRRVDEEARELLEEQAALERQVAVAAAAGGRSLALLVAVVAILATTFIGFEAGTLEAEKRAERRMEELARDEVARLDVERARSDEYDLGRERVTTELTTCRSDAAALERRRRILSLPVPRDYAPQPTF